jgi:hypothetical protein
MSRGSASLSTVSRGVAAGHVQTVKNPKRRRRSGFLPPVMGMLVSDEAPEATCLSKLCGSFRRPVRRFFPLHTSLWQGGDGLRPSGDPRVEPEDEDDRRLTGRGSGCGSLLRRVFCQSLAGGPGGSRRMVHHADRDPRPGDADLRLIGRLRHHPRRLFRPAVWMFATALAPCLCASEARPSDRGIQVLRHPTAKPSFQPFVRRETVAAGRGSVPARVLAPGAGPASPDIASSGVSEGGTATSVTGWKWAGMKKCVGVCFCWEIPLGRPPFLPPLPSLQPLPLTLPSPRRRGEGAQAVTVSAFSPPAGRRCR